MRTYVYFMGTYLFLGGADRLFFVVVKDAERSQSNSKHHQQCDGYKSVDMFQFLFQFPESKVVNFI